MKNITITDEDLVNGELTKQYPDIEGYFDCSFTNITSLEFAPQYVEGHFSCVGTNIKSLRFAPHYVGASFSGSCTDITSLEFAPQYVGTYFYCVSTKITSLKGIGKDYLKEVGFIILNDCHELKSNMLGLMLVKGLKGIEFDNNKEIEDIFNRHLSGERDILDCQEELITKGFKEYAKL
jgi:hypothetical protein